MKKANKLRKFMEQVDNLTLYDQVLIIQITIFGFASLIFFIAGQKMLAVILLVYCSHLTHLIKHNRIKMRRF